MTRKFAGQNIIIASHNSGKILEFEELFTNSNYRITSASKLTGFTSINSPFLAIVKGDLE